MRVWLNKQWQQHQIAAIVWWHSILRGFNIIIFLAVFFLIVLTLQWVFEIEQFNEIFIKNNAGLDLFARAEVLIDGVANFFRYFNDLTPVAILLVAFLQASIVIIWYQMKQVVRTKLAASALGVGIIGSGCVACGSSLLPLIASTFGSTVASRWLQGVGDILLLLAIFLAYRTTIKLSLKAATIIK